MLQALRGVLISVGSKMGENVRANVSATLLALQGHAEVRDENKKKVKVICLIVNHETSIIK